jgi:hypothetical protein
MSKIPQRYYYSNRPFTVHVNYNEQYQQEETFPAIRLDEQTYGWIQLMWPGATITTDPEYIESEEIQ